MVSRFVFARKLENPKVVLIENFGILAMSKAFGLQTSPKPHFNEITIGLKKETGFFFFCAQFHLKLDNKMAVFVTIFGKKLNFWAVS